MRSVGWYQRGIWQTGGVSVNRRIAALALVIAGCAAPAPPPIVAVSCPEAPPGPPPLPRIVTPETLRAHDEAERKARIATVEALAACAAAVIAAR